MARPSLVEVLVPVQLQARAQVPRKASHKVSHSLQAVMTGLPRRCLSDTVRSLTTPRAHHNVRERASRWVLPRGFRVARPPRADTAGRRLRASRPSNCQINTNRRRRRRSRRAGVTLLSLPRPFRRAHRLPGLAGPLKLPCRHLLRHRLSRALRRRWRAHKATLGSRGWASQATWAPLRVGCRLSCRRSARARSWAALGEA